jgi:hypothetical protein
MEKAGGSQPLYAKSSGGSVRGPLHLDHGIVVTSHASHASLKICPTIA